MKAIEPEIVVEQSRALARASGALEERSVEDVLAQVQKIQQLMASALQDGEHYGAIPGTGEKKTLLQPGAQKLCFMFRLIPEYTITRNDLPNGHREYEVRCELINNASEKSCGSGVGCCSTMESKYRWRKAERSCPSCGADTIKRSKFEDKGWYCYAKIGGCGAEFATNDPSIVGQEVGRKENPDIADTYNTVLKMAKKRAFVDATITATAAGDIFTQDLEETVEPEPKAEESKQKAAPKSEPKKNGGKGELTGAQFSQLWAAAVAHAHKTGATKQQIVGDVLSYLRLDKPEDIQPELLDRVLKLIGEWEPGVDFAAVEAK